MIISGAQDYIALKSRMTIKKGMEWEEVIMACG
jgi:hypothetical protein